MFPNPDCFQSRIYNGKLADSALTWTLPVARDREPSKHLGKGILIVFAA